MKNYLLTLFFTLVGAVSMQAQILEPVDWAFDTKDMGDGTYELHFTAEMDKGWSIYSQNLDDGGPVPTSFEFDEGSFEQIGDIREDGELIEKYDKLFEMDLRKYSDKVTFVATVKAEVGETIMGYLTFMTCDDQRCLPPEDVDFEFVLGK